LIIRPEQAFKIQKAPGLRLTLFDAWAYGPERDQPLIK
jgi:hypothetical protein